VTRSFETSVILGLCQFVWRHVPEDSTLHQHHSKNLKSRKINLIKRNDCSQWKRGIG